MGDVVLYGCGFDAFGLPVEVEAEKRGMAPEEWVRSCGERMLQQMKRLNLSLDYDSFFYTSDPDIYHWSQYIFLLLLENRLIYRDHAELPYCESCDTTLALSQVEDDSCWRCHNKVTQRLVKSWFLRVEQYAEENLVNLTGLKGWDKKAIQSQKDAHESLGDFPISRQRKWGCPIPITNCAKCGSHPVCFEDLPVKVGDIVAPCRKCGVTVPLETDTLDSHFDGIWKWIPSCVPVEARADEMLCHPDLQKWLPAAMIVAGGDIGGFLYDQRWLTKALRDIGPFEWLESGEPFEGTLLHEMVLAEDGQKMSKHLGNVTDPMELVDQYGADVVRVAVLNLGAPNKAVKWSDQPILFAKRFLGQLRAYCDTYSWRYDGDVDPELAAKREEQVKRIQWSYEKLQFQYVIKNCETLLNECKKSKGDGTIHQTLSTIVHYLKPIAPETCEELEDVLYYGV